MKYIILVFVLTLLFFSNAYSAETITLHLEPLSSGSLQPNTAFSYVFNFTNQSDCTEVELTSSQSITTNNYGKRAVEIDVSSIIYPPKYLCEYRDGSLRKAHNINSGFFNKLYVRSNITARGNITVTGIITAATFYGLWNGSVLYVPYTGATGDVNIGAFDFYANRVGIGTSSPDSIFHIKANFPGVVGSDYAGQIIIQNPANSVFSNAVITGYESDGAGNPDQQLWYLGSSSVGNSDITFLNRRNAKLQLGTSGTSRITILGNGNVGIGTTTPQNKLNVIGDMNVTEDALFEKNVNIIGNLTYKTIYAQLSDLNDQVFLAVNTKQAINLTTTDESYGIDVSVSNITILIDGVYDIAAQPQVSTGAGGAGKFHMWLEKHNTTDWINVSNSNVELVLANNEENVIPLIATLKLKKDEKIRIMGSVSDTAIILDAQSPAGEPNIPSIICRIFRLGD